MSPRDDRPAIESPESHDVPAAESPPSDAPTEGGLAALAPAIGFVLFIVVFIVIGLLQR